MTEHVSSAGNTRLRVVALSRVMDLHAFLEPSFSKFFPDVEWCRADVHDPATIDIAFCWYPDADQLRQFPNLKMVQSLGAGVDHLRCAVKVYGRPIAVCRVCDDDIAQSMAAYIAWAVIHRQRHMHAYAGQVAQSVWQRHSVEPPGTHTVGVAGLGNLGLAAARALCALGYRVRGWSRTAKDNLPEGTQGFHGPDQLDEFLQACDTLVCLLPLTESTRQFLGRRVFQALPSHAHVINAARGEHLVEADLLDALDNNELAFATLDVFEEEPLPASHPFWHHERILVTPHIGARTTNHKLISQMLQNLHQIQSGELPATAVDIHAGY